MRAPVRMTWRQWFCSLRGDHGLLKVEDGRVYLACPACGWESQGVTVTLEGGDRKASEGPTASPCVDRAPDPHIMLLKQSDRQTRLVSRLKVVR